MNVVAMIGMEIPAAPLSALFLEVVKIVIINVLLVSIQKQFEILILMFSLYLKLVGMKISDANQMAAYAKQIRTVAAEIAWQYRCHQYPILPCACQQMPHG